jgi:RNA polymerase sigma-70 factor (ECF subfamily)
MNEDPKMLFSKVMEDNKQRILRICHIYASGVEDEKDLYQDVALNIWKSLPAFRHEAAINTWIYRISLNVCMHHALEVRKTKQNRVNMEGIKITDYDSDVQYNSENRDRTKRLYACIAQLKEADKLLVLLFLEDISYKTMSEITGITENHVAVKLNRIKKKLFNCING